MEPLSGSVANKVKDRPAVQGTFILGLGAQKTGTTWVYEYLSKSPRFIPGLRKEYHIWDRHEGGLFPPRRITEIRHFSDYTLWRMARSPDRYFDHFSGLLGTGKGAGIVADITPAYCTLPADKLAWIRDSLAARGIAVRCLFIVRDPVARCISAVRMNRARGGPGSMREGMPMGREFSETLQHYFQSYHAQARTRYETTIISMDAAFAPEEQLVLVYEDMFTPENIARLSGFIGIEPSAAFANEKVFSTGGTDQPSASLSAQIAAFYRSTYEFCADRLPQTRTLWTNHGASPSLRPEPVSGKPETP